MVRILTLLLIYFPAQLIFPGESKNGFASTAIKISNELKIDGRLSEPKWQSAEAVSLIHEIQPGDNTRPIVNSLVKVLYNEKFLYFGFVCYDDSPKEIRATLSDRDQIFREDFVFIGLDTYAEKQRMYEFLINPLGVQADLMRVGNNEDATYDALWYSNGTITDSGYIVEVAIPFQILKFKNDEELEWDMILGRNYPRETRYIFSWTPFDRDDPCFICQSGKLRGLTKVEYPISIELLPYILGNKTSFIDDIDDPGSKIINSPVKGRAGIGLRILPSSDLTLEAVLNPDFSQIESDARVISLNNPFTIFYPEKRPFFLEGMDIFRLGGNHFYSRMINDPKFVFKITGKRDKFTFAALGGSDSKSPLIIPGTDKRRFPEY